MTSDQQRVDEALAANAAQVAVLADLVRRASEQASGFPRRMLVNFVRRLANQYVIQFGGFDQPADPVRVQALVEEFLVDVEDLRRYDPAPALQPFLDEAADRGVVWGARTAPAPGPLVGWVASDTATRAVAEIPDNVSAAVDATREFAESAPVESWSDITRLSGKAFQTVTSIDRSVSTAVADSFNDAVGQVARAHGARLLWVAEPDACVVCLKLSGQVIDPSTGEGFDETATFGRPGTAPDVWPPGRPLMRPPRHPHCHCVAQVWRGDVRGADVYDLPAALRREARRSILLGRAKPSESNTVRIDAARRLLASGSGLPRSVEERARRAVDTGRFSNRIT